jgi:AraC family transcriptional regulator
MHLVGSHYLGDNAQGEIGTMWMKEFIPREHEITGRVSPDESYGWSWMDESTPEGQFHYLAAFATEVDATVPEGMRSVSLPARRYAVFEHVGSLDTLKDSIMGAFDTLGKSGKVSSGGVLEVYGPRFGDGADSLVELWIPVG